MICPECGASNREGATYCDTCGKPLAAAAREKAAQSGNLTGMMTADWTIRSALAGIFGIFGAIAAASFGRWDFVALFVLISVAGWGFLAFTIRNAP